MNLHTYDDHDDCDTCYLIDTIAGETDLSHEDLDEYKSHELKALKIGIDAGLYGDNPDDSDDSDDSKYVVTPDEARQRE